MDRRSFLGGAGALVAWAASRRARAGDVAASRRGPAAAPRPDAAAAPVFFSDPQRAALGALADHLLPGAAALGAVSYIEQLLTAFDSDPPRIFAGGPFSGRRPLARGGKPTTEHPPPAFEHWLPLDRVQERAWRLRLYGSREVPHPAAALGGEVVGLRPMISEESERVARALAAGESPAAAWDACEDGFRASFRELVLEACFGDPVYGGNRGEAGWTAIHFPGDSLPLGYTPFDEVRGEYAELPDGPVSRWPADEGADPLGFGARLLLRLLGLGSRILVD